MYCESRSWDKYVIKESIIMIKQWRQLKYEIWLEVKWELLNQKRQQEKV